MNKRFQSFVAAAALLIMILAAQNAFAQFFDVIVIGDETPRISAGFKLHSDNTSERIADDELVWLELAAEINLTIETKLVPRDGITEQIDAKYINDGTANTLFANEINNNYAVFAVQIGAKKNLRFDNPVYVAWLGVSRFRSMEVWIAYH